jgi:hypothetical protein
MWLLLFAFALLMRALVCYLYKYDVRIHVYLMYGIKSVRDLVANTIVFLAPVTAELEQWNEA